MGASVGRKHLSRHAGAAGATLKRRGSIPRLFGAYTRRQSFVGRMVGRISNIGFALQYPPPLTPALSPKGARGGGSRFVANSKPEFGMMYQVGISQINNAVSSLSLGERARVRGF